MQKAGRGQKSIESWPQHTRQGSGHRNLWDSATTPVCSAAPFAVMGYVPGVGLGPKVVKDASLGGDREQLVRELGRQLAGIHQMSLNPELTDIIDTSNRDHAKREIESIADWLSVHAVQRPAMAWGLRWAERHRPDPVAGVFLHRDFRTGNFLIDDHGLQAILDWEFSGWGDPMADVGWFCAECWRFSRPDLEAGGLGSRTAFYEGYLEAGGPPLEHARIAFWEVMAHLRWAAIALQQGWRHLSGEEPSLAMAITSRIVDQLELIILRMTAPSASSPEHFVFTPESRHEDPDPRGQSRGADLLEIASKVLSEEVIGSVADNGRLPALMVRNALGIAAREQRFEGQRRNAENALLALAGCSKLSELVTRIAAGNFDENPDVFGKLAGLTAINSAIYQPSR